MLKVSLIFFFFAVFVHKSESKYCTVAGSLQRIIAACCRVSIGLVTVEFCVFHFPLFLLQEKPHLNTHLLVQKKKRHVQQPFKND